MGLSVVHGIVRGCGGAIYAYSEPGRGSSFKVFFPSIEQRLEPDKHKEEIIPMGKERILFIDDEQILINMGIEMLESLGYEVTTATNGMKALDLFKKHPHAFDLVITDMTMPQMTGDEMAKEMISVRPDVPVILCTGFSSMITEEKSKALGIRAFLMKPIVMREMADTIRKVLDKK